MKNVADNRKARHDYEVLEHCEAGIELVGTEVKSCRENNVSLVDSYARVMGGQLWLFGVHIAQYSHGNRNNHEQKRTRRLLVHKREIARFAQATEAKGLTLVPLRIYFNKANRIKVDLGLCRGRNTYDKRDKLRQRTHDQEARKAMERHR